jgi:SAM-dependent methyltransferase
MSVPQADSAFAGSIPEIYERYLVPLIFEPFAIDLEGRVAKQLPTRVLEIAAGTGVVTRRLAKTLPPSTAIVATDLNQAMLDQAATIGTIRPVEWRQADAMQLPFSDESFDAVACQFGLMFFADRPKALSEFRRVLRPGGVLIYNVWDRLDQNEISETVTRAHEVSFPNDPPRFLARVPYAYNNRATIVRDIAAGGFTRTPEIDVVSARSRADSARDVAVALCEGTPLRAELEARGPNGLGEGTEAARVAITQRFGPDGVDGKIQALVVTVEK